MKILGISCFFHDSAAALIIQDEVVAAAEEERFTRLKGDNRFPIRSIDFCLQNANLQLSELDAIVYFEKPALKFERILENFIQNSPKGLELFLEAMPSWLGTKLDMRKTIHRELQQFGTKTPQIFFSRHHLSHAASAFYPSPFENAAVLCIDGVGEYATTSGWIGSGSSLKQLWELRYPNSLGLMYSVFTSYCGFKANSGEFKLMGLASYGEPRFSQLIKDNLVSILDDGSFVLNMKFFGFSDSRFGTKERFHDLFGVEPRTPEAEMLPIYCDIAASIQSVTNEIVVRLATRLREDSKLDQLCLAGGVALNCTANSKIVEAKLFEKIWIPPASGDAGGALGAALAYWHTAKGRSRTISKLDMMRGAYLGPRFSAEEIEKTLKNFGIQYTVCDDSEMIDSTAKCLAKNEVVGWFQGSMEFGPRALGNRSILASPLQADMKETLNKFVKHREDFRPFAPVVTSDAYSRYFEEEKRNQYMTMVSKVLAPESLPAITHVDGTARVQSLSKELNPRLYDLLCAFERLTGHPVLINTSFNVRGQPLVCSPKEAVECFLHTKIDLLVIENFMIRRNDNPMMNSDSTWLSKIGVD